MDVNKRGVCPRNDGKWCMAGGAVVLPSGDASSRITAEIPVWKYLMMRCPFLERMAAIPVWNRRMMFHPVLEFRIVSHLVIPEGRYRWQSVERRFPKDDVHSRYRGAIVESSVEPMHPSCFTHLLA